MAITDPSHVVTPIRDSSFLIHYRTDEYQHKHWCSIKQSSCVIITSCCAIVGRTVCSTAQNAVRYLAFFKKETIWHSLHIYSAAWLGKARACGATAVES